MKKSKSLGTGVNDLLVSYGDELPALFAEMARVVDHVACPGVYVTDKVSEKDYGLMCEQIDEAVSLLHEVAQLLKVAKAGIS